MNVENINNLEDLFFEFGIHPTHGGAWGSVQCADAAGFNDRYYFLRVIQKDSTAVFIYAACDTCNPRGEFILSCNSIPPGANFIVFSNVSSLDAWKEGYDEHKYQGQLMRAGHAAEKVLERFIDVSSGTNEKKSF
jgi:hypothetical protein